MGTGAMIRRLIQENLTSSVEFSVASNPEFLREGSAIEDFMRPNRVVIGADDPQATAILKELYNPLYLIETPVLLTSVVTAEMIKYTSNAFLATKISFINEVALLCEKIGADVHDVAKGMGLDNRIGRLFLHPDPGATTAPTHRGVRNGRLRHRFRLRCPRTGHGMEPVQESGPPPVENPDEVPRARGSPERLRAGRHETSRVPLRRRRAIEPARS